MGNDQSYGTGSSSRGGNRDFQRRNFVASGDPTRDENAKKKYSDRLRDPNDINYNRGDGMERKPKDPFFDSMSHEDAPNRGGNPNYRGKNPRGGYRGRGGRGNFPDPKKDAETFGLNTAENFKFNHEQEAARGGGRGRGKRGGGNQRNDRDNKERDHYQNALHSQPVKKYQPKQIVDDGNKGFFDKSKPSK